jgi:membrane protein required for colicin V production
MVIGLIKGLIDGIVKQVISLISLILAIMLSGSVANGIRSFVNSHFNVSDAISAGTLNAAYYVLSFVFIITLFAFLAKFVSKIINYTPVGILNRLLGALFGVFLWVLCLSILFNVVAVFDFTSVMIPKQALAKSVLYDKIREILPSVYPYIKEFFKQ